jgi:hypothetical protein
MSSGVIRGAHHFSERRHHQANQGLIQGLALREGLKGGGDQ